VYQAKQGWLIQGEWKSRFLGRWTVFAVPLNRYGKQLMLSDRKGWHGGAPTRPVDLFFDPKSAYV